MENKHILELRAAFDRALSELAAVAESGAMPYEVRAAAMQAHISIAAKARDTIAYLHGAITPSGVSGITLKGADLIATLDKQARRISNAAILGDMREFRSGSEEHVLAEPGERPDNGHANAVRIRGLVKGDSVGGIEVVDNTTVKAGPQHTETFTNAAMPAGATVTHKWDKS